LAWSRSLRPRLTGACTLLLLAACAPQPLIDATSTLPPVVLTTADAAGIRDLRAHYRAALCARLADEAACERTLVRFAGEQSAAPATRPAALPGRYRIAFVPGFFSECFDRYARPFRDVERELRREGFTVDYFQVPGRGTTAANAQHLATHFAALGDDPRPIIVVAYSKGLVDVLDFVVKYPADAKRIAAVVSVAGAANGSPLADRLHAVYRDWVAAFPLPGCSAGTGDEIQDLRRDVRLEWWRMHRQQLTVPVFALVAAPGPEQVSPAMRATYDRLAQVDPRNDGKLVVHDQLVPGGFLLGYANADHWAIAIPVAEELPALAFMFRDEVPRTVLVRAAIDVVADTLASRSQ
jgi:hypothetical protein